MPSNSMNADGNKAALFRRATLIVRLLLEEKGSVTNNNLSYY